MADTQDSRPPAAAAGGPQDEEVEARKVFVASLAPYTTDDGLRLYFNQFGSVQEVLLLKEPGSHLNRGFGFVTFSNLDALKKALAHGEHQLDGKKLFVEKSRPQSHFDSNDRKLFVGNLAKEVDEEELKSFFSSYGKVTECSIGKDRITQEHRGFGFVTFESVEMVNAVFAAGSVNMNGRILEVTKAVPRHKGNHGGHNNGPVANNSYRPRRYDAGPPPPRPYDRYDRGGPSVGGGGGFERNSGYERPSRPSRRGGYGGGAPSGYGGYPSANPSAGGSYGGGAGGGGYGGGSSSSYAYGGGAPGGYDYGASSAYPPADPYANSYSPAAPYAASPAAAAPGYGASSYDQYGGGSYGYGGGSGGSAPGGGGGGGSRYHPYGRR